MRRTTPEAPRWNRYLQEAALPVVFAGGIAVGIMAERFGFTDINRFFKEQDSQSQGLNNSPNLNLSTEIPSGVVEQAKFVRTLQSNKGEFDTIFQKQLSVSSAPLSSVDAVVDFVSNQAMQHIIDSANTVKALSREDIGVSLEEIVLEGNSYTLANHFDKSLAAAILDLKLRKASFDLDVASNREFYEKNARYVGLSVEDYIEKAIAPRPPEGTDPHPESKITSLTWLKEQQLDIQVERGSWALIPTDNLLEMANTLQILRQFELPSPSNIRFEKPDKERPYGYYNRQQMGDNQTFTIVINSPSAGIEGLLGYLFQDKAALGDARMEGFSLDKYREFVYPDPDAQRSTNLRGEYTLVVARYLDGGPELRREIKSLSEPLAASAMRQYGFVQRIFKGAQFGKNRQLIEASKYIPGQRALINDPDTEKPGVYLRPNSDTTDHQLWGDLLAVFNGDLVELKESWVLDQGSSLEIVWKVRASNGKEGWIKERYLGQAFKVIKP